MEVHMIVSVVISAVLKQLAVLYRAFRGALIPGHTKLVMLESPTNPRMQICDIAALTAIAHEVPHLIVCLIRC